MRERRMYNSVLLFYINCLGNHLDKLYTTYIKKYKILSCVESLLISQNLSISVWVVPKAKTMLTFTVLVY